VVPPVIEFGLVNREEDDDVDELVLPPPLPPPPLRLVSCFADSAIALKESGMAKAWIVVRKVRRKSMVCGSFIVAVVAKILFFYFAVASRCSVCLRIR
jgi:hypothetical protein